MECFKTKYSCQTNSKHTRFFFYPTCILYLILCGLGFLDKQYFSAFCYFVCAVAMFVVQKSFLSESRTGKELPFDGIMIDNGKINICIRGNPPIREILLDDIQTIQVNIPYNDTLEITMKDHKVTRVPLYWFADEEQKRIKEALKGYFCCNQTV